MQASSAGSPFTLDRHRFEPAYLRLHRRGELQLRVRQAQEELQQCRVCPRDCGVDRWENDAAACKTGRYARVASFFPHRGEEDCLRGWNGSGTIFFSMCNLRCVFCQNFDISQAGRGQEAGPFELAEMMLALQAKGCHNINFVTPEHVVPQLLEGLALAVEAGLRLPLVYNTSAYDSPRSLQLLQGIIDIYMPDFKIWDEQLAKLYLKAQDYPQVARFAIKEMHRQVGALKMDAQGLALRGVLVRHLVMPGQVEDSGRILRFLADEVSPDTYLNVMPQYHPAGKVTGGQFKARYRAIRRPITHDEYQTAIHMAKDAGLWRFDECRLP